MTLARRTIAAATVVSLTAFALARIAPGTVLERDPYTRHRRQTDRVGVMVTELSYAGMR